MAAEAVGLACLGKISETVLVDCVVAPIKRQFNYMCCFDRNITELETQFQVLETTRRDVQMGADDDRRNVRVVGPTVEAWLTRANTVTTEVEEIIRDKAKVEEGCLSGWCPNLKLRYSLSRKAVKKTVDVVGLKADASRYTRTSYSPPPASLETITNRDFKGFESRKLKMEEILKALKHDEINLIGVCGMGGCGKTTLVNEVAKRAKEDEESQTYPRNRNYEIAMAVVGQQPNLPDVQARIASMLGLKTLRDEASPIVRADLLRRRLQQDNKKVLVVLDDVWEEFDLQAMGIPLDGANKNFKILYTSRNQDLWHDVPTKKEIPLELLSEDEAWQLFREKAGDSADAPNLQPIARKIVNECGRLPLALVLIGSALSKTTRRNAIENNIWEGMLRKLTCASSAPADQDLYTRLQLSYDYLENEEDKHLFLLCCLFEEDEDICVEDLARYGLGLSLFGGINDLENVRYRVFLIVDDLKSRYLLLDGDEECVKVHDVVRDMGISIAAKTKFVLVSHGAISRWPKTATNEHCTAISVISNEIEELPEGLTYPKLELLMLRCRKLKKLPPKFFEGMQKLKVLELYMFHGILTLQSLRNLTTLSLEGFRGTLDNVSLKGGIPNLEILNLRYSNIKELPEGIGELVNLRVLDLRDTHSLIRIPSGVISRLVRLEELYFWGSDLEELYFWGSDYIWRNVSCEGEEGLEEGRNANLGELELLSNLNTLEIGIDSNVVIPEVPIFSKLKQYKVVIGGSAMNDTTWLSKDIMGDIPCLTPFYFRKCKRVLIVKSSILIPTNRGGIGSLLRSGDCLVLEGEGCNDLVQALLLRDGVDGLQQLKYLIMGECDTPECLANTMNQVHQPAVFPILKVLDLRKLDKLREICRGPVAARSFGELTFIHVEDCKRLENLFQQPIVGRLTQLKHLIICHCDLMEQVIAKENQEDIHVATNNSIVFPKLEVLKLKELPNLVGFCRGIDQIGFPQLKQLYLDNIQMDKDNVSLFSLFPQQVSLPNLEVLQVARLHNLERLGRFRANSFLKLKKLKVKYCKILRNLFLEDMDVPTNRSNVFLELEVLELKGLPSLEGFCGGVDQIDFPQLKKLYLDNIPMVNFLFHKDGNSERNDNVKLFSLFPQELPNLEVLEVADLHNLERLEHVPTNSFSKLKELKVIRCTSLRNMFLPSTAGGLVNLQTLLIDNCSTLEAVFGKEGVNSKDQQEDLKSEDLKLFKGLKELRLIGIPHVNLFHITDNGPSNSDPNNNCQKISLPKLEVLVVAEFQNLERLEHLPFSMGSLSKLEYFIVHDCGKLLSVFPSQFVLTLQEFQELELTVERCISNKQNPEILPPLESVELCGLPKLNYISKRDPTSFTSIQTLAFERCDSLRYVFAPTMTKSIPQLRRLSIYNCKMLSRIVAEENGFGESSVDEVIEFPLLESLTLYGLPNLVSFFPKVNTTTPAKSTDDYDSPLQPQPLFNEKEEQVGGFTSVSKIYKPLFPQLKDLRLSGLTNLKRFCDFNHPIEIPLLWHLDIDDCPNMDAFSLGPVSTPNLKYPQIPVDGDLNTALLLLQKVEGSDVVKVQCPNVCLSQSCLLFSEKEEGGERKRTSVWIEQAGLRDFLASRRRKRE